VLCRRASFIHIHVEVKEFDTFKELYQEDSYFGPIIKQTMAWQQAGYTLQNGFFLFNKNQPCIPECSLCQKIVKEPHEEGNFGRDKTIALLSSSYWTLNWNEMLQDLLSVAMCVKDQKEDLQNARLYTPLPTHTSTWVDMSMDLFLVFLRLKAELIQFRFRWTEFKK
jgi:hypothetical protein